MVRTYHQIKDSVLALGLNWENGPFKLNFVWERTNDEITNRFTDLLHVCWCGPGPAGTNILTIPATTKPGLKGSILEPVTVAGVTGTAIIKPGQYINAWQFKDTDKEFSHYPYFRQIGPVDYWRDGDKDQLIDKVQDQEDKLFGTHWHVMSQKDTYGSSQINNWSLGCMGAPEPEYKKILNVVRESVKIHGPKFTGTIIESKNIK